MAVQDMSLWRTDGAKIADIPVHLVAGEAHKKKATPIQIPLEDGSIVSDHVVLQPAELTITAEMSNIDGNNAPAVGEQAKTAWEALVKLYASREPVEVTTTHVLYENMVVTALDGTNAAPYNGALKITATFTEISKVQLVRTAMSSAKGKNAQAPTKQSTQTSGAPAAKSNEGTLLLNTFGKEARNG